MNSAVSTECSGVLDSDQHHDTCRDAYYPVFLDLRGKRVLVVGGGMVAQRKVAGLMQTEATIVVVAPKVCDEVLAWASQGLITLAKRCFCPEDLHETFVVFVATNNTEVNKKVFALAQQRSVLVNVVDDPAHCNFIVPSVMKRGLLQLAVSTGGAAPALAKRLRHQLEDEYPREWQDYVSLLAQVRTLVRQRITGEEADRALVLEAACDLSLLQRMVAGEHLDSELVYAQALRALKDVPPAPLKDPSPCVAPDTEVSLPSRRANRIEEDLASIRLRSAAKPTKEDRLGDNQ